MSVQHLRKLWINSVVNKNIKEIVTLYAPNAIFKGTMMESPTKGRDGIKKYFTGFAPIVKKINFQDNRVVIRKENIVNEMGTYKFYTTEGVIKANYNFVYHIQDGDVKIVSHFSSLI